MHRIFFFFYLVGFTSFGQDSIVPIWEESKIFSISVNEVWTIDAFENVYISHKGSINKFNSGGDLMFTQSIKSLGRMKQLSTINTMKLVHFSEEQQTLCYFDNTLTSMGDCLDLIDKDILNASFICSSSQPNKIWILDNVNSKLMLLSLDNTNQSQELKNLKGVLNIEQITQILESSNRLYVLDKNKGVYIFDMYGTLIQHIEEESIQQLAANEQTLFTLENGMLGVHTKNNKANFHVKLPIEGVVEMVYRNQHFYLRNAIGVHKYALQFSE